MPTRSRWAGSLHGTRSRERRGRGPAPKTVANTLTALRSFFAFCERFDYIQSNPVSRIDPPRVIPRINDWLQPDEDDAMLAACRSPQERIVISFLRFTGLRAGELVRLMKGDVDLKRRSIRVLHSKTPRGRRTIPIVPELVPYIEGWLRYQAAIGHGMPTSAFLCTSRGSAIRYQQVYDTVKRVATRAGVRLRVPSYHEGTNTTTVSPHTLRRTFGSSHLNHGVRLEVVSRLLGHESSVTTERSYAALLDATIASELLQDIAARR